MLPGHTACVMNELPFSSYFCGCQGGCHNLQVSPAPAITLVCSWLRGHPWVFPAPVKTGLLLTREKRDVCPTRLASGRRAGYPRHGFRILSPQLGTCESVTKCLRPLFLRCQRRRRLPPLRIGLRRKIVGVILYWWGIVLPVWLIPTILAGFSGLFCVVFPTWSPLTPQILDSKARCVAPTALPLHKGNPESLLGLLSEGSSEVLFFSFWLDQSHCFQLGI